MNGHPLNNSGTICLMMTLVMIMVIIVLLCKKFPEIFIMDNKEAFFAQSLIILLNLEKLIVKTL